MDLVFCRLCSSILYEMPPTASGGKSWIKRCPACHTDYQLETTQDATKSDRWVQILKHVQTDATAG